MNLVEEQVTSLRQLWSNKRVGLNLGMIVFSALMIWKGLMVVTESESPVVVVLSGSMEPAFQRGDILLLDNRAANPLEVGDVVVYKVDGRDIPIVHRVLEIHERADGDLDYLTKGDNNAMHDRGLYKRGQLWLRRDMILGKAVASAPYVGMVTILLNDYPAFKYVLVGLMGLFVLTSKE